MTTTGGLALLEKPKQKLTMITIGGGMMGCDARTMIVTQGKLPSDGRMVLAYAAPRAKKKYRLSLERDKSFDGTTMSVAELCELSSLQAAR